MASEPASDDPNCDIDRIVVAAIDFGTTYSGYAYSTERESGRIFMNKNWASHQGSESFKTPTCILATYSSTSEVKHSFEAFGFEAYEKYGSLRKKHKENTYCLYDKFKMKLHRSDEVQERLLLDKCEKVEVELEFLIQQTLKFMKKHLLDSFEERGWNIKNDQIRWVLTVPAIWSDKPRLFMTEVAVVKTATRQAAYDAGLMEEIKSGKFRLALEPEAASLYCRQLHMGGFQGETGPEELDMSQGTSYILVDAGGGTVDIVVHRVADDGRLDEMIEPSGGPSGGSCVNDAFWNLLEQVLGHDFLAMFIDTSPNSWFEMDNIFEMAKRTVDPESNDDFLATRLPITLANLFREKNKGADIKEFINTNSDYGLKVDDEYSLFLKKSTLCTLFSNPIEKIVEHLNGMMKNKQVRQLNVKYLFMVGGFSQCRYLSRRIRDNFKSSSLRVLIPEDPALAIAKGAVLFGQRPHSIRSRIARRTYGVATTVKFNPHKHMKCDGAKLNTTDGVDKCINYFHPFIRKGDAVDIGGKITRLFIPKSPSAKAVSFLLLSTASDVSQRVRYSDKADMKKVGYIKLPLSHSSSVGHNRRVAVTFKFGGIEIQVTAKEMCGDKSQIAKVDFFAT